MTLKSNEIMQRTGFNAIYKFSGLPERNFTAYQDYSPRNNSNCKIILKILFLISVFINKIYF